MFVISKHAKEYILKNIKTNQKIQIQIVKGGCAGIQYQFKSVSNCNSKEFDWFNIDGIEFYIAHNALIYLCESILSYKKTQTGYLLYFDNPKLSFCKCGKSCNLKQNM